MANIKVIYYLNPNQLKDNALFLYLKWIENKIFYIIKK